MHRYAASSHPSLGAIIPKTLLSRVYCYCAEQDDFRLFYAILDLELVWLFSLKDSHSPAGLWNQVLWEHRHSPKTILEDFSTFCARMDILDSFNSISLRLRACWDKYLGILVLLHEPDKYEVYARATSRKRKFTKIAREWEGNISRHIVQAITTVFRNRLVHAHKLFGDKLTKKQIEETNRCIEFFLHHELKYPDPAVDLMTQHIDSIDQVRTPEAHGTGVLRKWSLASLPPDVSKDFSLYNHSNDFSVYMNGLHRSVTDLVGNDAGSST